MKKLICFLLSTFTLLSATAQDSEIKFNCYGFQKGTYNEYTKNTDKAQLENTDFGVTLFKNSFRLENKAGSLYILKDKWRETFENSERMVMYWNGIDEQGIKCLINIIKFKGSGNVQLQCHYTDMIFYFHLSPL